MTATQTRSTRLARALSDVVARRFDRRGFFSRTAMAGTALAVAPTTFALRPGTAYSAICSCQGQACDCGSMCCSGYTEFCCTLNGRNTCPPNTLLGGWWKVDGTGYCSGPRYYMDCNAPCGGCGCGGSGVCSGSCSGTGCGCANGDCNNRKAGCVQFRYGQCNNDVACLGPILCRVVTCIPPWEVDASCTTTARVDEFTRYHDRPCLHGVNGALEGADRAPGGVRVWGWALDPDTKEPIDVEVLVDGTVVATVLAGTVRSDIGQAFPGHGPLHGFDATVQVSGGRREVCVRAVERGPNAGGRVVLGCRTVLVTGPPEGALDQVRPVGPGRVRVSGWAHDPDTTAPIEVHIYADGIGKANVRAELPRPDVAAALGIGPNHGFATTIDVGGGAHEVCAYAINVGDGGNVALGCATVDAGNHRGSLDALTVQPGALRLVGWAMDIDSAQPVDVHVYVDGVGQLGLRADLPRPDVAASVPGAGIAHGFDVTIPVAPGDHVVDVYALNVAGGGGTSLLAKRSFVVGGDPVGVLDGVRSRPGALLVSGWALDPDTAGPIDVHVYVDGVGKASVPADRVRADVGRAFPGFGDAHGFEVSIPVASGPHEVCAFAINTGSGSSSPLLGCRSAMVGGSPVGIIDAVRAAPGGLRVTGWALDPDTADPIEIHVYADGVGRANVLADRPRGDVATAHRGWGEAHGFDITIPLDGGSHELCLYAINRGLGGTTLLDCRTESVGGSPLGVVDAVRAVPGGLRVTGWALDPDTADPIEVHVYADGIGKASVVADRPRPDVAATHRGWGEAHGFDVTIPLAPGPHEVCAYAINTGVGGTTLLDCRTQTA